MWSNIPLQESIHPFGFCNRVKRAKKSLQKTLYGCTIRLISCSQCGIALRMVDKKSERIANESTTYRKLFEISARILDQGKTLLMKTSFGYRLFFALQKDQIFDVITRVMFCDANIITGHTLLIKNELDVILSIERPLLRVATKSDTF